MHNYRLTIEYDGRKFCGWQVQPGLRTVQGTIQDNLEKISGRRANLIGAGRTDSGVHAFGQVANFKSTIDWGPEAVRKALNRVLSEDITILACEEAESGFHARFSAVERSYEYRLWNDRSSIRRGFYWCLEEQINFACLKRLALEIIGEHDFKSFCVKKSHQKDNHCTIQKSCWTKKGKDFTFHISANRFLHGMVRSLVGSMIMSARGVRKEEEFKQLLIKPERSRKVFTAPPDGLYLKKVKY